MFFRFLHNVLVATVCCECDCVSPPQPETERHGGFVDISSSPYIHDNSVRSSASTPAENEGRIVMDSSSPPGRRSPDTENNNTDNNNKNNNNNNDNNNNTNKDIPTQSEAEENLIRAINIFIRTRKGFDSISPLCFRCPLRLLFEDEDVNEAYRNLHRFRDVTLLDFIHSCHYFELRHSSLEDNNNSSNNNDTNNTNTNDEETVSLRFLTPYQGPANVPVFGYFQCSDCQRSWFSSVSWRDKWQKCRDCDSKCYPYCQLAVAKDEDGSVHHDNRRCQVCIEQQVNCTTLAEVDSISNSVSF